MTTTQSRKAKGRHLQKAVAQKIRDTFKLGDRDVQSRSMGASGTDVMLSDKAFKKFKYSVECKNQERVNIWDSWEQAKANRGTGEPLLIIKRNRSDTLAVVDLDHFMELALAIFNYRK